MSIDSESYSTIYLDVVESVDEAVKTLLSREANNGDGLTVSISKDDCKTRITLSDNQPDEYFTVAEVMPMPAKRYFVGWWHAYDGVGFDLKGSANTREEAMEMLDRYVNDYYLEEYKMAHIFYEKGDSSFTIDTGNEWESIEVFDTYQLLGIKEVA